MQFLQKDALQSLCDLLFSRIYARLGQKTPQIQVFDFEADLFSGIRPFFNLTLLVFRTARHQPPSLNSTSMKRVFG